MARAMCGLTHVTVAALFCSCSLLCISDSDWATDKEAGRWRELSLIEFSCDCHYSLVKHNKTPVYSTWGLLRVCACVRPARLLVLTWVSSSFPPGTISKIRFWLGPQRIQQGHFWNTHGYGPLKSWDRGKNLGMVVNIFPRFPVWYWNVGGLTILFLPSREFKNLHKWNRVSKYGVVQKDQKLISLATFVVNIWKEFEELMSYTWHFLFTLSAAGFASIFTSWTSDKPRFDSWVR